MTLKTLFENFELFVEAPTAVDRIRDLVLDLAVRGRLVDQDPAEGEGHSLLNQIRLKNGLPETAKDVEEAELGLSDIPGTWALTNLGEVAEIIRGVSFPGSAHSTQRTQGNVACLRTASVQSEIDWKDLIFIPSDYVRRPDQWIALNDIIISMANSYALVGKVAIVRHVPERATLGAFLAAIRPSLIDHYFLLYVLRSPRMQAAFRASSTQTTNIANISLGRMRPLPFPIPPLAEQKRIVAKVDELMALCDRLEAQQQERETRRAALAQASLTRFADAPTPANLSFIFHKSYDIAPDDLRRSILNLAVQGGLALPNPKEGATLIVSMEDLVGRKSLKNGLSLAPTEGKSDFSCLPLSAMRSSSIDCYSGKPVSITPDRAAPYLVKPHDIFIIRGNGSKERVGIAGIVRTCPPNVLFPDLFIRVPLPADRIVGDYFLIAWNSPSNREALERSARTTSGIWKVNQGHISDCEIPLPPLAEQRRIVAKVNELMALVDNLEAQLATARTTAAKLLDALVSELTA